MGDEPAIDPTMLEDLAEVGGDAGPDLVKRILRTWIQSSTDLAGRIQAALAAGDAEALAAAAHPLKSSSAQVGAMLVSRHAAELEALGKAGTLDSAGPLVGLLEDALVDARERLSAQVLSD